MSRLLQLNYLCLLRRPRPSLGVDAVDRLCRLTAFWRSSGEADIYRHLFLPFCSLPECTLSNILFWFQHKQANTACKHVFLFWVPLCWTISGFVNLTCSVPRCSNSTWFFFRTWKLGRAGHCISLVTAISPPPKRLKMGVCELLVDWRFSPMWFKHGLVLHM